MGRFGDGIAGIALYRKVHLEVKWKVLELSGMGEEMVGQNTA
jgi:hypothetical protein